MSGMSPKEIRTLLKSLDEQGVNMKRTKNGYLLYLPDGRTESVHLTPSEYKGTLALRASIKKAGLKWPTDTELKAKPVFEDFVVPDYISKGGTPLPRVLKEVQDALETLASQGHVEVFPKQIIDVSGRAPRDYATIYRALIALDYEPVIKKGGQVKRWRKRPDPVDAPPETEGMAVVTAQPVLEAPAPAPAPAPVARPAADSSAAVMGREFIDTADTWTVELRSTTVSELTMKQLKQVYMAAGLQVELRVWRDPALPLITNGAPAPEQEKIKNGAVTA
jgi:hypothetical protein